MKKVDFNRAVAVNNLEALYALANPLTLIWGRNWYNEANAYARKYAQDYGFTVVQTAGVIAALSPNNKWLRNLHDAENLLRAYRNGRGKDSVRVSTYNSNKDKAWRIIEGEDAYVVLKPKRYLKVWSFFNNIVNLDIDVVTIDGHAINAAMFGMERRAIGNAPRMSKALYHEVSSVYQELGAKYGIKGREFQSVVWEVYRRLK